MQGQQERKLDFWKLVTSNSNWVAQYDKDFWEYCTNLTNNPKTHFYTLGFHKSQYDAINFFEYVRQFPIGLIRNEKSLDAGLELQSLKNDRVDFTPIKTHIGSSMEILRIGLNLPERMLIFININVFQPQSAFWYTDAGDFELERLRAK